MQHSDETIDQADTSVRGSAEEQIIYAQTFTDDACCYDLFIFNASCETSINIRGKVDYFIAHTTMLTHITQSRGRYRGDLETLYVLDHDCAEPITVPEEFLDIQLFKEDQRELRVRLSIKDKKGHYLSYPKQWERIETSGYTIDCGRDDDRRYVIIRRIACEGDGNP